MGLEDLRIQRNTNIFQHSHCFQNVRSQWCLLRVAEWWEVKVQNFNTSQSSDHENRCTKLLSYSKFWILVQERLHCVQCEENQKLLPLHYFSTVASKWDLNVIGKSPWASQISSDVVLRCEKQWWRGVEGSVIENQWHTVECIRCFQEAEQSHWYWCPGCTGHSRCFCNFVREFKFQSTIERPSFSEFSNSVHVKHRSELGWKIGEGPTSGCEFLESDFVSVHTQFRSHERR
jgi:hypothetical protein